MSANRLDSVLHYVRKVIGAQAEQGSDADLLQRFVRHHDETAFELLMWRHAALVLRVCQGVLRDSHAAEDAFQATFLALARKAGAISRRESLAAWLYQVAYRVAVRARLNAVERRALEARRHERRPPAGPRDEVADRDLVPLVHEELSRLAAKYRTPLILCYLEGKTHAEAAAQLGWAKGTVSGRLARGREMLKKRLVRRGILFPASVLAIALAATKTSAIPPALVASTIHAAVAFAAGNVAAAGVSTGVIHLTYGVLHAMCLSKIKATTAAIVAFLLIFAGAGALIRVGIGEVSAQGAAAAEAHRYPPQAFRTSPAPLDFDTGDESGEPGQPGTAGGSGLPGDDPSALPGGPGGFPGAPAGGGGPGGFPGGPVGGGGPGGFPGAPGEAGGFPGGPGGLAGAPGGPGVGFGGPGPMKDTLAERKRRIDSVNNLKQIALAFHNYHDTYGFLPSDIVDEEGRPLLSWRVAILPFIEQDNLYKQFKLDEPWDSAHNKRLQAKMPALYRINAAEEGGSGMPGMPGGKLPPSGGAGGPGGKFPGGPGLPGMPSGPGGATGVDPMTYYQGFVGKGTAFDRSAGQLRLVDFSDGTSNTILLVEAGTTVPWSKPEDIPYSAKKPIPALGGPFADVIHAAFADGSVHSLRKKFDQLQMRRAIVRNDGEVVDFDKLEMATARGPGAGGAPGMMGGGPGGPKMGGPGMMPKSPLADGDVKRLHDENAKLEELLQQTAEEMQALRQEMAQLKDLYGKRQEQAEAKKLLSDREKLRQQLEDANAELKAMRDELQRLKRGLDKP